METKRLGDPQKTVQLIDNIALVAQSAVVGALRHFMVERKVCSEEELDEFIRGTIRMVPMPEPIKEQIRFLALGPGAEVREGIGNA